jgi:hypothetical protein
MMKYTFLLKPLFYIISLIFSCWMVLKIEKLTPSDFGKYESMFNNNHPTDLSLSHILYLKQLCKAYKAGVIDSVKLDSELQTFLKSVK